MQQKIPIRMGLVLLQAGLKSREEQWASLVGGSAAEAAATAAATVEDDEAQLSKLVTRAFHFIAKKRKIKLAVTWAKSLYNACEETPMDMSGQDYQMMMMMMMQGGGQMARMRKPPTSAAVRETLRSFVTKYKVKGTHETDEKFDEFYSRLMTTDKFDTQLAAAEALTASLGVTELPSMFVNGQLYAVANKRRASVHRH